MEANEDEERLLHSVVLQNASTILHARQRAEEELIRAKESLERKSQELAKSLAMMRATLEATSDGILVTDGAGQVTNFNEKFLGMWRLPRPVLDPGEQGRLLEIMGRQSVDFSQYCARIAEIHETSPPQTHDLLELTDGRVFERTSQIQYVDNRNLGRVWSFCDVTERRRTEEALQKQSEWLRVTLSSIGDAVIATDQLGQVTFLNGVAETLTGWNQADALGRPLPEVFLIVNEQSRQPVENPALRALREGTILGLANHTVLIARDGTERPIDDSAAPIRDKSGAMVGAVLVFRDVTERKRAEASVGRLAAIVESSEDAIVSKTLEARILSWNAGAERLFGYTAEEAIGQPITIIIPPDRQDEERLILARIVRGERVEHFETVRLTKHGREVDISLTISPIHDSEGQIIGASKVARDISARKQSELALKKQTERLQLLWAAAAILLTTEEPEVMLRELFAKIALNLGLDAYLNYMVTETGDALRLESYVGIPEATARSVARLEFGQAISGSVALRRQPLVLTHIQQSDDPIADLVRSLGVRACACTPLLAEGRLLGTLAFASRTRDCFDDDELEFLRTLAHYVTVVYERMRLVRELQDADRKKDDFIALLGHELRNPLAPIRNGLQVIRLAGHDPNAVAQARDMMDRQLGHMVRLIDDLLDVSRIGRHKMELRRTRVLLADVVGNAVETARPVIEEAGHELSVALPVEPVWLDVDLTRIAQVLSNLLTNSAKYTERGGRIWLAANRTGDEVVMTVRDTGIGIPATDLASIFDMFTQVDRNIERSTGGLGIGLALVKGLVEVHGGTVSVASDGPGKGSLFTVRLPVRESLAEPVRGGPPGDSRPAGPRQRILVVDDNRDAARTMARVLKLLGNDVDMAHDGIEALETAERFQPEVVLMDVGMPRLNGYEATRRIREQPWGKAVTIIALTGWGQDGDRLQSSEAGCDGHLVKPVHLPDLQRLLVELTGRANCADRSETQA